MTDHIVSLRDLGAAGDGSVSNDHFQAAINAARAGRRMPPEGAGNDHIGTKTIEVPAGDYRITDLMGLMGTEWQSLKIAGLRFRGAGSNLTTILFDPAEAGPLAFNDFWMNIAFEGFTFRAMGSGATFMQSYTTHAAQRYTFTDVSWSGPWRHVLDLKGDNNNCEFSFYACQTSGMADDGAFLHIGAEGTSDQFLNYWFFGFKHWSTAAPLVDAAKGGHFHFYGLDVSDWAPRATEFSPIFRLRGKTHAGGVQTLTANGMRVEAKNPHAALIESDWGDGNVTIQCDWSSQVHWVQYGDIIRVNLDNVGGPIYNFHDSNLAGGVRVAYSSDTWRQSPVIRFTNCGWAQRLTPSEVVTYTRPVLNRVDPGVEFAGCRGAATNPYASGGGAAVWDATVGDGALVRTRAKRSVSVRAVGGNLSGTSRLTMHLPVGAVVTGLEAVTPGGTAGSWEAWTTETAPRLVASTEGSTPFLCTTREQATITINATKGDPQPTLLLVEGYW